MSGASDRRPRRPAGDLVAFGEMASAWADSWRFRREVLDPDWWLETVGADLASLGNPAYLHDGELAIDARDSPSAEHLRYCSEAIRAECNSRLGSEVARRVHVRNPDGL